MSENWPNGQIGSTTMPELKEMRAAALEVCRQSDSNGQAREWLDMLGLLAPLREARK